MSSTSGDAELQQVLMREQMKAQFQAQVLIFNLTINLMIYFQFLHPVLLQFVIFLSKYYVRALCKRVEVVLNIHLYFAGSPFQ